MFTTVPSSLTLVILVLSIILFSKCLIVVPCLNQLAIIIELKINITKDSTTIVNGGGNKDTIDSIESILTEIDNYE